VRPYNETFLGTNRHVGTHCRASLHETFLGTNRHVGTHCRAPLHETFLGTNRHVGRTAVRPYTNQHKNVGKK
jgi:hypothetical protein